MERAKHRRVNSAPPLTFALILLASAPALGQAVNVEKRALANRDEIEKATRGVRFALTGGVFFRSPGGNVGFMPAGDVFYDFRVGPLVLAPGVRMAGYFTSDFTGLAGLGTLTAGVVLGPALPFALGGVGFGVESDPSEWGLSYVGGGGVMFMVRSRLSLGAEVSYQGFAFNDFDAVYFGPRMEFTY